MTTYSDNRNNLLSALKNQMNDTEEGYPFFYAFRSGNLKIDVTGPDKHIRSGRKLAPMKIYGSVIYNLASVGGGHILCSCENLVCFVELYLRRGVLNKVDENPPVLKEDFIESQSHRFDADTNKITELYRDLKSSVTNPLCKDFMREVYFQTFGSLAAIVDFAQWAEQKK